MTDPHFAALAVEPRPAGGPATERARIYCTSVLSANGFTTTERPFEFSAFPGAYGAPVLGGWSILTLLAVCACGVAGRPTDALVVLVVSGASLVLGGWLVGEHGVLSLPLMRRQGVNLECVRGKGQPNVWLVAHVDSKSQPVPMLLRAASVVLLLIGGGAALTLAVEQRAKLIGPAPWWWMAGASVLIGLPLLLSFVGARNSGALDNATGMAAVLGAAELLPRDMPLGILITDAEELALAGARAWCVGRPTGVALNCDTIDDHGTLTVMPSARRRPSGGRESPRSRMPTSLKVAEALRSAAQVEGEAVRVTPLIPGVLTDSVAFGAAGWATITLSRGTVATLGRIHSKSDDLGHLQGTGIAVAARVLAGAAQRVAGALG